MVPALNVQAAAAQKLIDDRREKQRLTGITEDEEEDGALVAASSPMPGRGPKDSKGGDNLKPAAKDLSLPSPSERQGSKRLVLRDGTHASIIFLVVVSISVINLLSA